MTGLTTKVISKLGDTTVGNVFSKPTNQPLEKPTDQSNIPKFKGISGWDKFKNFLGGIGSKVGLTTHQISDADYVWNPKKDK